MHGAAHASDEALWRAFTRRCVAVALSLLLACFAFVALVDPHDHLPLSLPFERAPINTNQRFSYPALARSERFDSAIVGTSTARLLRPSALDRLLDARFVNLSMNSATAYEQWRILELFLRHHPHPDRLLPEPGHQAAEPGVRVARRCRCASRRWPGAGAAWSRRPSASRPRRA